MYFKNDFLPLLRLAIPFALTGLVSATAPFFETLFLAHVDQTTLAAGALVGWLYATFAVILYGTLSAMNVLIAHKKGAGDHLSISFILRDGVWLSLLLVIPSFLLFWNMAPIFLLLGQDPSVVVLAESYLHALAWGLLPTFITMAIFELIIGLGHARVLLSFNLLSVSLILFFSYALIFGHFGFPALGIAGAGWGLTISYSITVIGVGLYVLNHQDYKNYFKDIFKIRRPSFLRELLHLGLPMGMMYCFEVAFFFTLMLVMGAVGSELLAANQIVFQYLCILMSIIFSIARAITVRMGHLIGAREIQEAQRAAYMGILICGLSMSGIAIIFWLFPSLLISVDFDLQDPKNILMIKDIKTLLIVSAVFQIFEATRIALFGALRALKDTRFTLLTSIISFWGIALPLGYLLATYFQCGSSGFWWGMVFGAACSSGILFWRFQLKMSTYEV
jgi:MATE family multidrug resistance protein